MQTDIILAGVGGQGIVSISFVIDMAALKQGWSFKQAEVHGMSQRGGEVLSHLRVGDQELRSELVPRGGADLVLSIEPLESLRYVDFLKPGGVLVTSSVPFVNIADYPELEGLLDAVASLQNHLLIHAEKLAREAGNAKAENMVLLGAASSHLGLSVENLETSIHEAFARKGEKVQRTNIDAFRAGRAAASSYRACLAGGLASRAARVLGGRLAKGELSADAVAPWREVFAGPLAAELLVVLAAKDPARVKGTAEVPRALLAAGKGARLSEILYRH